MVMPLPSTPSTHPYLRQLPPAPPPPPRTHLPPQRKTSNSSRVKDWQFPNRIFKISNCICLLMMRDISCNNQTNYIAFQRLKRFCSLLHSLTQQQQQKPNNNNKKHPTTTTTKNINNNNTQQQQHPTTTTKNTQQQQQKHPTTTTKNTQRQQQTNKQKMRRRIRGEKKKGGGGGVRKDETQSKWDWGVEGGGTHLHSCVVGMSRLWKRG